jgi:acetyltransferase-like isoleucine patch superfamily enzyme
LSSRATVFLGFELKENCFILEDNTIQPFARVGTNVTLWSGNHIGHHSTIEDDVFIASHVVVSGGVRIGQGSFVGVNVTLRDHVTVGQKCILGAGALVLEDLPDFSVVAPRGTERSSVPRGQSVHLFRARVCVVSDRCSNEVEKARPSIRGRRAVEMAA